MRSVSPLGVQDVSQEKCRIQDTQEMGQRHSVDILECWLCLSQNSGESYMCFQGRDQPSQRHASHRSLRKQRCLSPVQEFDVTAVANQVKRRRTGSQINAKKFSSTYHLLWLSQLIFIWATKCCLRQLISGKPFWDNKNMPRSKQHLVQL